MAAYFSYIFLQLTVEWCGWYITLVLGVYYGRFKK